MYIITLLHYHARTSFLFLALFTALKILSLVLRRGNMAEIGDREGCRCSPLRVAGEGMLSWDGVKREQQQRY